MITSLGGRSRTQRSPLLVTRRKAQRLASRIEEEARKVALSAGLDAEKVRRALPFVQESVFLHGDQFHADMPDLAKSSLFGMDGREDQTGLPGISTRLLEPPPSDSRRVDEDLSVIIALALQNLGGIARRTERDAGSWTITGKPLANGIDWQEWSAKHKATGTEGRARIVSLRPGTPAQARAAAHRRMQREFSLLSSLRHESIVAPRDLVQDDDGNTVLIFPPDLPEYEQLDLALATRELTAEQQIQVLTEVSEALAYAHRNQVAHRGLSPSTVLINTHALDEGGTVRIRLADWSWAGRVHSPGTQSSTMLGTPDQPGTAVEDVYQAPPRTDGRPTPTAWRWTCSPSELSRTTSSLVGRRRPATGQSCWNDCDRNKVSTLQRLAAGLSTRIFGLWCSVPHVHRSPSGWPLTERPVSRVSARISSRPNYPTTVATGSSRPRSMLIHSTPPHPAR